MVRPPHSGTAPTPPMPWTTRLMPAQDYIESTFSGQITPAELQDAFETSMALVRETDCRRILADCTRMQGGHSVIDLYFLADALLATGLASKLREAVLLPELPDSAENVRFWETTCANRGIRVRVFTDRAEAMAWLLE